LIALCFAELGSKITVSGGPYAYINEAFGPYAGFIANYIFVFGSCVLSDAAIANALSMTLTHFFPQLADLWPKSIFFVCLFILLSYINIKGVKYGLRFVMGTAFFKLVPIILLIGFGFGEINLDNLAWDTYPSLENIGLTTLILFYAFVGVENVVSNGGEFKNPSRTVPVGISIGIIFIVILYIFIQVVSQGILGDELVSFKDAPLTEVATRLFGKYGIAMVVIGIAISMLGGIGGSIMAIPRIVFAGARNGIYPKRFAEVHDEFKTPHWAIIFYSSFALVLALFGDLKQLIILSSASCLIIYLGVVFATIKLRNKSLESDLPSFKIPGGYTVPVLATIFILYILSSLSKVEFIGIGVAIAVLSVTYFGKKYYETHKPIR
jgi:amino acid transporter